jgi:glycolate oxidase FAD binding subunit
VLDGALSDLESCRAEIVRSTLTPERCDWQSSVEQGLQLRIVVSSVSDAAVEEQLQRLDNIGRSHGLTSDHQPCSDPRDNGLTCSAPTWLVRVVLPPAKVSELLQSPAALALTGWSWDVAAGAGCGDGWSSGASQPFQVEALRRSVIELGGALTVLVQPETAAIPAWLDTPARPVIEAVKRQFDPRQQLCRGRLPGVNQDTA